MIGFGQNNFIEIRDNETSPIGYQNIEKIGMGDIGPQPLFQQKEGLTKIKGPIAIMSFPYPMIFIHGLKGDWSSWWDFYGGNTSSGTSVYGLNDWGWTFGGYLDFCLNSTGIVGSSNLQAVCNINADITNLTRN